MSQDFVGQLLDFLFSPLGILAIVSGIGLLIVAHRSPRVAWFAFSLCCFTASLSAYTDEYITVPPELVFPLQQLRAQGRPLTFLLLGVLLLISLPRRLSLPYGSLPLPMRFLFLIQGVIIFKTALSGSLIFALITLLTIATLFIVIYGGPARWIQTKNGFWLAVWSMASTAAIFIGVNLYQAFFNIYPIMFVHNRFLGTTGNPQHAATLLAALLPSLLFMIATRSSRGWERRLWVIVLTFLLLGLYLTGSRAGMLMAITTFIVFYYRRPKLLLRLLLLIAVTGSIFFLISNQNIGNWDTFMALPQDRYTNFFDNSRAGVWGALWRTFQTYPIFGNPLSGDRLYGYGESSWLGTAAALGLVGLVPLLLCGLTTIQMFRQLNLFSRQRPEYFYHCSTVIAGLAALFVGSIFEAYLLGNLNPNVFLLLLYWVMGQYLVDIQAFVKSRQPEMAMSIRKRRRVGVSRMLPSI